MKAFVGATLLALTLTANPSALSAADAQEPETAPSAESQYVARIEDSAEREAPGLAVEQNESEAAVENDDFVIEADEVAEPQAEPAITTELVNIFLGRNFDPQNCASNADFDHGLCMGSYSILVKYVLVDETGAIVGDAPNTESSVITWVTTGSGMWQMSQPTP